MVINGFIVPLIDMSVSHKWIYLLIRDDKASSEISISIFSSLSSAIEPSPCQERRAWQGL